MSNNFSGIHAREWIANAVATYQIKELLENDAVDSTYLDTFNIYILPMANPDGYEYSRGPVSDKTKFDSKLKEEG